MQIVTVGIPHLDSDRHLFDVKLYIDVKVTYV